MRTQLGVAHGLLPDPEDEYRDLGSGGGITKAS
jgi:hypothetical protein